MPKIRLSADLDVKKGDPSRIVQAMSKKEIRKLLADACAHVLAANAVESAELTPSGAFVHIHDHSGGSCQVCRSEAAAYLPNFNK